MTKIVAILNITPDSFSDGGKFFAAEKTLQHLQKILEEGADVIDVGAESTRPGATAINAAEEWLRLENILPQIIENTKRFNKKTGKKVQISIDSYHFETIKEAFAMGVEIVNDVSGLEDEKIVDLVAKTGVKTVFMHSLSVPTNPEIIINDAINVVDEILRWGREKIAFLEAHGVKKSQLIFDPGIGFSKNAGQSIRILKNIERFKELGVPIYVGHSKKRFFDEIFKNATSPENKEELMKLRAQKTLLVSEFLASKNVDFIRVHDVLENKKAISEKKS